MTLQKAQEAEWLYRRALASVSGLRSALNQAPENETIRSYGIPLLDTLSAMIVKAMDDAQDKIDAIELAKKDAT